MLWSMYSSGRMLKAQDKAGELQASLNEVYYAEVIFIDLAKKEPRLI